MENLKRFFYGYSVDIGVLGRLKQGEIINFDYKGMIESAKLANKKYLDHTIQPEELMIWLDIMYSLRLYGEVERASELYTEIYNHLFKDVTL